MANFILNGWYCAAWSHELADGLVARRLLDIPVVIFRDATGAVSLLRDRCPHRFAPLSKGFVEHGSIVCGYHGLAFDGRGQCVHSPFNKRTPPDLAVTAFPSFEKWGVVWFWPGDPALASPDELPDFAWLGDEPGPHGYLHVKANYQLILDNLLDLSHIEFVHLRTFGGAGAFFNGAHSTDKVSAQEIWSRWWMPNVPTPMPARARVKLDRVDHWQDMRWTSPSNCVHELGIMPVGNERSAVVPKRSAHLLTPETATSTHYFYSMEAASGLDDGSLNVTRIAFEEEDGPMIEAVQQNMAGGFWDERPAVLGTDASAILVRRTIEQIVRAESKETAELFAVRESV